MRLGKTAREGTQRRGSRISDPQVASAGWEGAGAGRPIQLQLLSLHAPPRTAPEAAAPTAASVGSGSSVRCSLWSVYCRRSCTWLPRRSLSSAAAGVSGSSVLARANAMPPPPSAPAPPASTGSSGTGACCATGGAARRGTGIACPGCTPAGLPPAAQVEGQRRMALQSSTLLSTGQRACMQQGSSHSSRRCTHAPDSRAPGQPVIVRCSAKNTRRLMSYAGPCSASRSWAAAVGGARRARGQPRQRPGAYTPPPASCNPSGDGDPMPESRALAHTAALLACRKCSL